MIEGKKIRCSDEKRAGWTCWNREGQRIDGDDIDVIDAKIVRSKGPIETEDIPIEVNSNWINFLDITFDKEGSCAQKDINNYRPIQCKE